MKLLNYKYQVVLIILLTVQIAFSVELSTKTKPHVVSENPILDTVESETLRSSISLDEIWVIEEISQIFDGGLTNSVVVNGNYAYIADDTDGLEIIDISDPTNPIEVGQVYDGGLALEVVIDGNYAYIADHLDGIEIIDISDPTNPIEVGQFNSASTISFGVVVVGDYAYNAGQSNGLQIIDISDPTNPSKVGQYSDGGRALNIAVSGNYAYIADYDDGLEIVDISNPSRPVNIALYNDSLWPNGVAVNGNYVYLANDLDGVVVINITDPTNPVKVGQFYYAGSPREVVIDGSYAYIMDFFSGLRIIDISNPTNPVEIGQFFDGGTARDVFISKDYTYLADYGDGLEILSVTIQSEPAKPQNLFLVNNNDQTVSIDWDEPIDYGYDNVIEYRIYRGLSPGELALIYSVTRSSTYFIDTKVYPGVLYYYAVSAVNSIGEGELSDIVSISTRSTPTRPQNVSIQLDSGNVMLWWDPPLDDGGSPILNYLIYRGISEDNVSLFLSVSASLTIITDTKVDQGNTYYYMASAVNILGEGELSNIVSVIILNTTTSTLSSTSSTENDIDSRFNSTIPELPIFNSPLYLLIIVSLIFFNKNKKHT